MTRLVRNMAAAAVAAGAMAWTVRAEQTTITVDPAREVGPIKILNAVNNGPSVDKPKGDQVCGNARDYKAARFPYARLHDSIDCCPGGAHAVDITAIFPNFDADENDPKSYDFAFTDAYLKAIEASGTKVFYRLGQTIEHGPKKYGSIPPKDFAKWARICEHVIRHYNEGWADGFKMGIEYWEIWNEPNIDFGYEKDGKWINDLDHVPEGGSRCWGGSANQFFEFYETAAKHLKGKFPALKIGGPALCGVPVSWFRPFLERMQKNAVPLDFFSWHEYGICPDGAVRVARLVRKELDAHGFAKTESILNEWNYVRGWQDDFVYSLRAESGDLNLVGGAYCASMLTTLQNEPVDMLMYYDARVGAAMNGLFERTSLWPQKTYYALYAWAKLLDRGRQVSAVVTGDNAPCRGFRYLPVGAVAAKGKDGSLGIYVSRYMADLNQVEPRTIRLAVKGRSLAGAVCHVTDDRRMYTETPLEVDADGSATLVLQPRAYAFVEVK